MSNEASKAEEGHTVLFDHGSSCWGELTLQGGPGSLKTQHCPWCFIWLLDHLLLSPQPSYQVPQSEPPTAYFMLAKPAWVQQHCASTCTLQGCSGCSLWVPARTAFLAPSRSQYCSPPSRVLDPDSPGLCVGCIVGWWWGSTGLFLSPWHICRLLLRDCWKVTFCQGT